MARRSGVPSANSFAKQPIMDTAIRKNPNSKKGITCTLYNPRVSGTDTDNSFTNRLEVLKQHFTSKSNLTGIVAANPPQRNCSVYNETHYGKFGSTLANQLRVFLMKLLIFLANFKPADDSPVISDGEIIFPEIPAYDINKDFWSYVYTGDSNEETFLNSLNITFQDCVKIEKDTRNQSDCSLWFELRKPCITSSKCHRIFIRQRNFDTLCTENMYRNPCDFEDLPAKVKKALNHGKKFESRARDVMRLKLRHFVQVRETGLVIQPFLFWLVASPDGLVTYQTSDKKLLLEIKYSHTMRHMSLTDLVQDPNFCVNLGNSKPVLKKSHFTVYYSQIQLAMGLSGFDTCGFVVYTFKGLIIVRNEFGVSYFDSLIQKLNSFYEKFMSPRMVSSLTN